jgi:fumarylacetoacetase
VGDLLAAGTISGTDHDALGCMLEMTRNGQEPLHLLTGEARRFLEDGDTLRFSAQAHQGGIRIGFGELCSTVAPAVAIRRGCPGNPGRGHSARSLPQPEAPPP